MDTPRHDIPIPFPAKAKSNPRQILAVDNRDDRTVLHRLLSKLPPRKRVHFLDWACSKAILPGSRIHPKAAPSSWALANLAMRDDSADERLTMDVFLSLVHLGIDYSVIFNELLLQLEDVVRKQR